MNKKLTLTWLVDATLFAGFLVAFFLDLTGLELHQWIGIAAGALAIYHLTTHWNWVSTVTERFLGKTAWRARLYYLIDLAIFTGFVNITITGLVISSWLNLTLSHYDFWLLVHILVSIATLVLTAVKLGLHWRWLAATTRKVFSLKTLLPPREIPARRPGPVAAPVVAPALAPAPAPGTVRGPMSRAEFLKVIGVVGAASVLALGSAGQALKEAVAMGEASAPDDAGAGQAGGETAAAGSSSSRSSARRSSSSSASASSGSSCVVSCGRSCSYPGHCRRYVDSNGNGRCDLGECA